MIVILDSGHNEQTLGKMSADGKIKEWEYTYCLTQAVIKKLALQHGIQVYHLDNDRDRNGKNDNEELRYRVILANAITSAGKSIGKETMLISIHLDASSCKDARGASVFIAPNASEKSKTLANIAAQGIVNSGLGGNRKDLIKVGNFAIIRDTKCPAVLIECAFMTNEKDEEFLLSSDGFYSIVDFIYNFIKVYIVKCK